MPTEQTTRIPVTIASYSLYTSVSQSILREATAVNLLEPEETTTVNKDNRPTTDFELKNTSVPHMKTMPVQRTEKATSLATEAAAKTTTMTTEGKHLFFENTIISEDRANVGNADMVSKTGLSSIKPLALN